DDEGFFLQRWVTPRQQANDVGCLALLPDEIYGHMGDDSRDRKRVGLQGIVDVALEVGEALARRREDRRRHFHRSIDGDDAGRGAATDTSAREQLWLLCLVVRASHDEDPLGAMFPSVDDLVAHLGVMEGLRPSKRPLLVGLLGFVRHYDDDLLVDIEARIIIVIELRRRDAIARERHLAADAPLLREAEGLEANPRFVR